MSSAPSNASSGGLTVIDNTGSGIGGGDKGWIVWLAIAGVAALAMIFLLKRKP